MQGSVAQCQTLPQTAFENKCEFQGQCCAQAGAALKGRIPVLLPDLGVGLLPESRGREYKCCCLPSSQANPELYWHRGPPCNDKRPWWPLTVPPKSHLPSSGFLQQENNLEEDEITDAKCPVQHLDHGKCSMNTCVRNRRSGVNMMADHHWHYYFTQLQASLTTGSISLHRDQQKLRCTNHTRAYQLFARYSLNTL